MSHPEERRILAIDLHTRSFSFAVFEGERELLDWGGKSFRGGINAVRVPLGPKVARLLDQYLPEILVLVRPKTKKLKAMGSEIRKQASAQRIPVRLLSEKARMQIFADHNKHQIALRITEQFPELLSILPHKRKPWESEDYRMNIFDAAAVGIAFFAASKSTEKLKRRTLPAAPGEPKSGSICPI